MWFAAWYDGQTSCFLMYEVPTKHNFCPSSFITHSSVSKTLPKDCNYNFGDTYAPTYLVLPTIQKRAARGWRKVCSLMLLKEELLPNFLTSTSVWHRTGVLNFVALNRTINSSEIHFLTGRTWRVIFSLGLILVLIHSTTFHTLSKTERSVQ